LPTSGTLLSTAAAVTVAQGGTGITSGTSGGILAFTASGTIASSGALTANLPVIGGGAGVAPTVGTRSGNTTKFTTTTGTLTNGDCVSIDASGNLIDAGGPCTVGGGGGTVAAATIGQMAIYTGATTVGGVTSCNNGYIGTDGAGVNLCRTSVNTTLSATITTLGTIATGVWNGTNIALANGGTNNNITADNGGIVYSDASKLVLLASTVTAGQCLLSGSSAAPTWGACSGSINVGTAIGGGTNGRVLYDNSGAIGELPVTGSAGNVVLSSSPTIASPTFTGTVTGPAGTWTASGLNLAGGGLGITSGTSGGVPYFSSTSTVASSGALTSGMPVFGGGAGASPIVGTISGTGTKLASASGSYTSGNCIKSDASGNLIDNGTPCGGGAVLLNTLTASTSASIQDTTSFTSTYKFYDLVFVNILAATNSVRCIIQVQNSATFQTTGYLASSVGSGTATAVTNGIPCSNGVGNLLNSNSGISGTITVVNPSSISVATQFYGQLVAMISGPNAQVVNIGGEFNTGSGAVTGFKVLMSGGNITSGNIYIYGRN